MIPWLKAAVDTVIFMITMSLLITLMIVLVP